MSPLSFHCGDPLCTICGPLPHESETPSSELTEPAPEPAPVFSKCVIGYRTWALRDWVLVPISFGEPWRPGVNTAQCVHQTGNPGMQASSMFGPMAAYIGMGGRRLDEPHAAPAARCLRALRVPRAG